MQNKADADIFHSRPEFEGSDTPSATRANETARLRWLHAHNHEVPRIDAGHREIV